MVFFFIQASLFVTLYIGSTPAYEERTVFKNGPLILDFISKYGSLVFNNKGSANVTLIISGIRIPTSEDSFAYTLGNSLGKIEINCPDSSCTISFGAATFLSNCAESMIMTNLQNDIFELNQGSGEYISQNKYYCYFNSGKGAHSVSLTANTVVGTASMVINTKTVPLTEKKVTYSSQSNNGVNSYFIAKTEPTKNFVSMSISSSSIPEHNLKVFIGNMNEAQEFFYYKTNTLTRSPNIIDFPSLSSQNFWGAVGVFFTVILVLVVAGIYAASWMGYDVLNYCLVYSALDWEEYDMSYENSVKQLMIEETKNIEMSRFEVYQQPQSENPTNSPLL